MYKAEMDSPPATLQKVCPSEYLNENSAWAKDANKMQYRSADVFERTKIN